MLVTTKRVKAIASPLFRDQYCVHHLNKIYENVSSKLAQHQDFVQLDPKTLLLYCTNFTVWIMHLNFNVSLHWPCECFIFYKDISRVFLVYFSTFSPVVPFLSISFSFSAIFLKKSFCFHWIQVCPFICLLFLEVHTKWSLIEGLAYYVTYGKLKACLPYNPQYFFFFIMAPLLCTLWGKDSPICKMLIVFYVCVNNHIMVTCIWLVQKDINVVVSSRVQSYGCKMTKFHAYGWSSVAWLGGGEIPHFLLGVLKCCDGIISLIRHSHALTHYIIIHQIDVAVPYNKWWVDFTNDGKEFLMFG